MREGGRRVGWDHCFIVQVWQIRPNMGIHKDHAPIVYQRIDELRQELCEEHRIDLRAQFLQASVVAAQSIQAQTLPQRIHDVVGDAVITPVQIPIPNDQSS